jgi:cell division protein FtsZ
MVNNDELNNVLFIGIGGAGASLASQLHSKLGADSSIVVVNTDEAALQQSATVRRLLIGQAACGGQPAHTPSRGRGAAEESHAQLQALLDGAALVVIAAGLGGGTGTGAAPVMAKLAHDRGVAVIAAVTLPFTVEGNERRNNAIAGWRALEEVGAQVFVHDHAARENTDGAMSLPAMLKSAATSLQDDVARCIANVAPLSI